MAHFQLLKHTTKREKQSRVASVLNGLGGCGSDAFVQDVKAFVMKFLIAKHARTRHVVTAIQARMNIIFHPPQLIA